MNLALGEITFFCSDTERVSKFWGELLGAAPSARPGGCFCLEPKVPGAPQYNFQPSPEVQDGRQREHFDLWTDDLKAAIASAEAMGGNCFRDTDSPCRGRVHGEFDVILMADPEGRRFCLVGPASRGGS